MVDAENRINKIRSAYKLILHRESIDCTLQQRINALQFLEKETGANFRSTEHFLAKMDEHIAQISGAEELKRVRKDKNLSLEQLGKKLGYSEQFVHQMERGTRPLTTKTVRFIEKPT